MRLDGIENSIEILNGRTKYLEERMDDLIQNVKQNVTIPGTNQLSSNPSKKGAGYQKHCHLLNFIF
jgi:hypothetical protein